ncbi:MAG: AlkZ family DNA glycosylase, partial [Pseudonocardia sp.]|nr:AlkZ family DNA glycosylase [Pseudonocardia sp.]
GRSGQAAQTPLDTWLGRAPAAASVDDLVLRYLAAFGPATVRDVQLWCGLTKLSEVVDGLRERLVTFADSRGRELFDVPDAPRPDPDTPAPVRFLYDFDNLLLSHVDRSRIVGDADFGAQGFGGDNQEQPSSVLVDGVVAATWKVARSRGVATLTVRAFRVLTATERENVVAEGLALLGFLRPTDSPVVEINCR